METPLIYKEPQLVKAVVNGLIATVILWSFWTPFIIFIAVPLVNNQLKMAACQGIHAVVNPYELGYDWSNLQSTIVNIIFNLGKTGAIPGDQLWSLISYINNTNPFQESNAAANTLIQNDPSLISSTNWSMYALMILSCLIIIGACILLSVFLTHKQNLDGWAIVRFNLLMAVIIMAIEATFFLTVATKYVPFDPSQITQDVGNQSIQYLNSLTGFGNASSS